MDDGTDISDRGETYFSLEPLIPEQSSKHRPVLHELAEEVATASRSLSDRVPAPLRAPLLNLLRSTDCYYSNLIEGHDLSPIKAGEALREPALIGDNDPLVLEARSHIAVQEWMDTEGIERDLLAPDTLREIHRQFCEGLPAILLLQDQGDGRKLRIAPGEFRGCDVKVGDHIPPSPAAVPRLLSHMHKMYRLEGRLGSILAVGCAHHRLAWVHPFPDMNGRVIRLVSRAMFQQALGSDLFWSLSRGIGRNIGQYHKRLAAADARRPGGADGRGSLSEARLAEFAQYFLTLAIEEISFMEKLLQPDALYDRVVDWANTHEIQGSLPEGGRQILSDVLKQGFMVREQAAEALSKEGIDARPAIAALLEMNALIEDSPKGILHLNFPVDVAPAWLPELLPQQGAD